MLKLKLQYSGPPDAKNWLIGKDPDAGSLSKLWELVMEGKPGMLQSMEPQTVGQDWATEMNSKLFHTHTSMFFS